MEVKIEPGWKKQLETVWQSPQFAVLADFVRREYATKQIFPPAGKIFAAMDQCPFELVKVVIIGQDPYHGVGQANGLSFSVNPGVAMPPSLVNIFKEIHDDVGSPIPPDGDLSRWAAQGVLLLNSSLTVEAHRLSAGREHLVFMLWGSHAGRKAQMIDSSRHLILQTVHPSPLSAYRGFFGCRHFSRANDYLVSHGITPIQW